jgi:hypothetical protein
MMCGFILGCIGPALSLDMPLFVAPHPIEFESDSTLQTQAAQFDFSDTPRPAPIQGLKIKSKDARKFRSRTSEDAGTPTEPYAFPVMLPGAESSARFCESLIKNLQFLTPEVLALANDIPIRTTIFYDKRSSDDLRRIPRPSQLAKSDCDELVPNHDSD